MSGSIDPPHKKPPHENKLPFGAKTTQSIQLTGRSEAVSKLLWCRSRPFRNQPAGACTEAGSRAGMTYCVGLTCFSVSSQGGAPGSEFQPSELLAEKKSESSQKSSSSGTFFTYSSYSGRNEKPNRTGRNEPNRTVEFRNRPDPDAETNRTEPDRATTSEKRRKNTSNRENYVSEPNQAEPMNFRSQKVWNRNKSNRIGSFLVIYIYIYIYMCHASIS